MLTESRLLRRGALAFTRNSGSVPLLARGMGITQNEARDFLAGKYHFVAPGATRRLLRLLDDRSREYVEANARTYPIRSQKLPMDVIAPVVDEGIEQFGSIGQLAFETGVAQRRLYAMSHRREGEVGLPVADRIITYGVGPFRWHEPDLRRWYFGAEIDAAALTD